MIPLNVNRIAKLLLVNFARSTAAATTSSILPGAKPTQPSTDFCNLFTKMV
jgi:hypothetical protein